MDRTYNISRYHLGTISEGINGHCRNRVSFLENFDFFGVDATYNISCRYDRFMALFKIISHRLVTWRWFVFEAFFIKFFDPSIYFLSYYRGLLILHYWTALCMKTIPLSGFPFTVCLGGVRECQSNLAGFMLYSPSSVVSYLCLFYYSFILLRAPVLLRGLSHIVLALLFQRILSYWC